MYKFSESAREREVFRYEASAIAGTIPSTLGVPTTSPLSLQTLFQQDPILTALAQLCALRLEAACAYISFFETQSQHVVACACPTSSIFNTVPNSDLLGLCGRAFPRNSSISEHVLQLDDLQLEEHPNQSSHGEYLPISHIPDLAADPRFAQHIFVIGKNGMRWYAAVPIKSPRGANIGVLSLFHPDARPESEALSENGARALRETSCAITKHMELQRAGDGLRRNERMVRGLGSFVEGNAGMSFSEKQDNVASFEDAGGEGSLNPRQQFLQRRAIDESHHYWDHSKDPESPSQASCFSQRPRLLSTATSPPLSAGSLPHIMHTATGASTASIVTVGSEASEEDPLASVKTIFSKAANVIRESLEVEGVLFLDASIGSFGGLVSSDDRIPSSMHATEPPTYSSSSEGSADSLDERYSDGTRKLCNVFGFSTSESSSIDCDTASSYHTNIPEKLLSTLLRRHPRGRIFHFGADGTVSSGDSEEEKLLGTEFEDFAPDAEGKPTDGPTRQRVSDRPWSKRNEGASVLRIVPEARSAIFIPLWDAHKERWYAGGLVWTRTPTRLFTREGELSYLQAFGTTIMSEIMRFDALVADRAKADVLGSLSHELRSPLHGVLAAVDLLRGEALNAFQADILHSLESCGRTLLDVLNHLLDYSKVNTYLKKSREDRHNSRFSRPGLSPKQIASDRLHATVQLDVLVEECVNSAFAGHAFQMMSIAQTSGHNNRDDADVAAMRQLDAIDAFESFGHQGKNMSAHGTRLGKVSVFLQIDPQVNWTFRSQSGAIRRILLNVFGNALKYTEKGYICVSVHQETIENKTKQPVTRLKLTVLDSGKGINPKFLQQKLFTPFAQEDRLAPGTGLGLSLVKQIVRTLFGSITVESQVGVGTCVRVSVPLKSTKETVLDDDDFAEQKEALRGLRVSLAGLDHAFDLKAMSQAVPSFPPPVASEIMKSVCSDWLQMRLVDLGNPDIRPDLIIGGEAGFDGSLSEVLTPTVIVCSDAVTAHSFTTRAEREKPRRIIEYISQPVGPRKLAKALGAALNRWIEYAKTMPFSPEEDGAGLQMPGATDLPLRMCKDVETMGTSSHDKAQSRLTLPPSASSAHEDTRSRSDSQAESPSEGEASQVVSENGSIEQGTAHNGASSKSATGVHEQPDTQTSSPETFLLVDDNKINLQILVSFMTKLKRPYNTAANGLEAYERYTEDPGKYRCILMDLSMPVMDGLESCRRIREFERGSKLRSTTIVALTGLASKEIQREAFASGMDMFYTKPVKLKDISTAMTEKRL